MPLDDVRLLVGGQPVSTSNPLPTSPPAGGSDANIAEIGGAAAAAGAGATTAGTLRTATASDSPDVAALGATTGVAVTTDANGTIQQYLRGLVTRWAAALGAGTAAAALRTTKASDSPDVAALGATTGAAVTTDADGTIQQYLRGLVTRWAAALGAGTAAAALRTTKASDSPDVATLGATTGAAVTTDANGTIQQYLRGLVTRWANALGAGTAAAALRTTQASDSPDVATLGATTGAAVTTDANGTIQQYLRGLVTRWANALGAGTAAASLRVNLATDQAMPAGENQLGDVGRPGDVLDVTLTLDTSAYAAGDVLADTQAITSAVRENAGRLKLVSCRVLDEDDQGGAFDVLFLDANNSLGSENSAPNISDTNARAIIGGFSVLASDYIDIGGSKVAMINGIDQKMKAGAGVTTIYIAAITRGAPTHTASGLKLKLGVEWY